MSVDKYVRYYYHTLGMIATKLGVLFLYGVGVLIYLDPF